MCKAGLPGSQGSQSPGRGQGHSTGLGTVPTSLRPLWGCHGDWATVPPARALATPPVPPGLTGREGRSRHSENPPAQHKFPLTDPGSGWLHFPPTGSTREGDPGPHGALWRPPGSLGQESRPSPARPGTCRPGACAGQPLPSSLQVSSPPFLSGCFSPQTNSHARAPEISGHLLGLEPTPLTAHLATGPGLQVRAGGTRQCAPSPPTGPTLPASLCETLRPLSPDMQGPSGRRLSKGQVPQVTRLGSGQPAWTLAPGLDSSPAPNGVGSGRIRLVAPTLGRSGLIHLPPSRGQQDLWSMSQAQHVAESHREQGSPRPESDPAGPPRGLFQNARPHPPACTGPGAGTPNPKVAFRHRYPRNVHFPVLLHIPGALPAPAGLSPAPRAGTNAS